MTVVAAFVNEHTAGLVDDSFRLVTAVLCHRSGGDRDDRSAWVRVPPGVAAGYDHVSHDVHVRLSLGFDLHVVDFCFESSVGANYQPSATSSRTFWFAGETRSPGSVSSNLVIATYDGANWIPPTPCW